LTHQLAGCYEAGGGLGAAFFTTGFLATAFLAGLAAAFAAAAFFALNSAHRFLVAAAMRSRAAGLMFRFFAGGASLALW
jgi:hypothetical protein